MIPGATAASFLLVVILGAMSPGPDFVVVTRSSLTSGRRAGIAAGAGIALGVFAWVVAIALGVAAVLTASAVAFSVVKLVGAVYLVVLGIRAWLAVRRGEYRDLGETPAVKPKGAWAAFRQGLFTNLLNPKVAVYFLALLPQFLPADGSTLQTLELAAIATMRHRAVVRHPGRRGRRAAALLLLRPGAPRAGLRDGHRARHARGPGRRRHRVTPEAAGTAAPGTAVSPASRRPASCLRRGR